MMQENCIHFQMKNVIVIKYLNTVQLTTCILELQSNVSSSLWMTLSDFASTLLNTLMICLLCEFLQSQVLDSSLSLW